MSQPAFQLFNTVRDSYRDVFGDVKKFFRATWLVGVLLLLCVELPMHFITQDIRAQVKAAGGVEKIEKRMDKLGHEMAGATDDNAEKTEPADAESEMPSQSPVDFKSVLLMLVANVAQMLIILSFSVAWFRALLLHEKRDATIGIRFGKTEWNYLWTNMKASFVMTPIVILIIGVAGSATVAPGEIDPVVIIILVLGFIFTLYAQARITLCYPLSAIGQNEQPLKQSWHMTKQCGWAILFGMILIFVPLTFGVAVVAGGVAWLGETLFQSSVAVVDATGAATEGFKQPLFLQIILKVLTAYFTLMFVGILSAFQARVYASLLQNNVHSSSPV